MAKISYPPDRTGLLLQDPYNDFLSEGGKLWPLLKEVAEEVHAEIPPPAPACQEIRPDLNCWFQVNSSDFKPLKSIQDLSSTSRLERQTMSFQTQFAIYCIYTIRTLNMLRRDED